jgi:DnaJ domain
MYIWVLTSSAHRCCLLIPRLYSVLKSSLNSDSTMGPAPYQTLGLTPWATQTEVRQRYKQLALLFHPDKNAGKNHELWVQYQLAYEAMMKRTNMTSPRPSAGESAERPFDTRPYTSSHPEAKRASPRPSPDLAKAKARAEKEKQRQEERRQYEQEQERVRKRKWKAQQTQNAMPRKPSDSFYEWYEREFYHSGDSPPQSPPPPAGSKKARPTPSTYSYGNPKPSWPDQAKGGAEWQY